MTTTTFNVTSIVAEHYIETGEGLTVADIVEKTGATEYRVRKALQDAAGIGSYTDHRESHSRDYPMFTAGTHRVEVYVPTKSLLRDMIRTERKASK